MMKKNFLICGTIGWCLEIIFTAMNCLMDHNSKLIGHTSLWMFPIYGMAAIIYPLSKKLQHLPMLLRGLIYGGGIFGGEFLTGSILRLLKSCPWDYSGTPYNIQGLIRLDYFPFWVGTGLLFEQILIRMNHQKDT